MEQKETLAQGKYLSLVKRNHYEMVERVNCSGVVVIVPTTSAGEIVFVEQYRLPVDAKVIELPAGLVNDRGDQHPEESLEEAAKRELLEETGFETAELERIGVWPTTAGMSSEMVTAFFARRLTRKTAGGGDHEEDIAVHIVKLNEADRWLKMKEKEGFLVDPKIFAGLYLLSKR